ncbi:hypothetical protein EXIGLDRAFT_356951 [Exidia glandulosa HHB12029]|uniref:Uncharacterized protein n=1 Tax=Exidia glandulosa HHB12029 TaxID=1314781 RepID=A0A165C930_EXIGL|nr:hypothetical protein EXIGLDRAFT_356951 [Exidia glandulosa HHB12029]
MRGQAGQQAFSEGAKRALAADPWVSRPSDHVVWVSYRLGPKSSRRAASRKSRLPEGCTYASGPRTHRPRGAWDVFSALATCSRLRTTSLLSRYTLDRQPVYPLRDRGESWCSAPVFTLARGFVPSWPLHSNSFALARWLQLSNSRSLGGRMTQ